MGESSPDLSLRLRRGSSDSRDSFYMDFAQGIDSDIEEVTRPTNGSEPIPENRVEESGNDLPLIEDITTIPEEASEELREEEEATLETFDDSIINVEHEKSATWPGLPAALPSPASPSAVIVSPETLSRYSSSSPSRAHRPPQFALTLPCSSQPIPAVCYPATTYLEVTEDRNWKNLGADALATTLSALYGKLLVVMGIAFPMAEVISTYIPPSFYEAFYLYLYFGSMIFLLYMYATLLRDGKPKPKKQRDECDFDSSQSSSGGGGDSDVQETGCPHVTYARPAQHYGSFYLRMGAVAFGIGSMIYSGLEFGQYFELERDTKCHNVMLALTPATRMAFIFIQMYFIFLNNEQMKVYRHRVVARIGLMHMIGTNLSVWLNVLVQETKHEILTFYNPENNSLRISHRLGAKGGLHLGSYNHAHHGEHVRLPRGLKGPHHMFECRRTNIMGSLVQDASPFLFPCTIEYSLICAAILYVMWKNISKVSTSQPTTPPGGSRHHTHAYRRSPHHYSVDCARAHKGLFVGILILVLTIISLILFFVLISRPELVSLAVTEVNVCELTLYGMSTLATLIGMFQMRKLRYDGSRNLELDNILLVAAQTDFQKRSDLEDMQRCPYLHEMKERLLSQPTPTDSLDMERLDGGGTPVKEANLHNDYPAHINPGVIPEPPEMPPDPLIGIVVKLNSDGYGSHTSPAHARQPLVPQSTNNPSFCLTPSHLGSVTGLLPKNANGDLLSGCPEQLLGYQRHQNSVRYCVTGEEYYCRIHEDGQIFEYVVTIANKNKIFL